MLDGQGIKRAYEQGIIHILPFEEGNIGPNSYDLTLGEYIWRFKQGGVSDLSECNAYDMFYEQPVHREQGKNHIIYPQERILAHTNEFAGAIGAYVPQIACRSTIARLGLDVCGSAGFGDLGYINRWTLEIYNYSNRTILIPVGARICQLYFTRTYTVPGQQPSINYNGNYNITKENMDNWKPEMMLPHLPLT